MKKDAVLSSDGVYRYLLSRNWRDERDPNIIGGTLGFIMLNPSTADANEDDPTIRRCIGFARRWNYEGIEVGNLFALRATDPVKLRTADEPIGAVNDAWLDSIIRKCKVVVAAWGAHPFAATRAEEVCGRFGDRLSCLGVTKAGHPKHPLYLRADTQPVKFDPKGIR